METITLKVNESVFDKFQWLMSHFSKNEIEVVNEVDILKLSVNDFDYICDSKMTELNQNSKDYKSGNKDDFEEYVV